MFGLAGILLLGVGAQWLAWRLRLPSILVLLAIGFAVGPLTSHRLLDPDELLGEALLPFVGLAVAVVLFEGGLSLRLNELRAGGGGAVRNLVLVGAAITWMLAAVAAHWILELGWGLSLLLGAILIVTGPTVILPLLRYVRPSGVVGSVLRWEGIMTDPIGAIAAVLVFQAIALGGGEEAASATFVALGQAIAVGAASGTAAAVLLLVLLRRNLVPDFLHVAVTLALVIAAYVVSNLFQAEAGLLAVTLMGCVLANQRHVVVRHIAEHKENLSVLLIGALFILLAARLPREELTRFDVRSGVFVAVLILLVRPAAVFLSTLRTRLSWRERAFVAWMAPRGIVAAAVASVFSLELAHAGHPEAERLVPIVFLVIVATVAVYGLTCAPLARLLRLSQGVPQGVLFLGAHSWARRIARSLADAGVRVYLVDTNHADVQAARLDGLPAYFGNALAEEFALLAPLDQLGNLVAVTHSDEVNALACLHFAPIFGRAHVFQLDPEPGQPAGVGGSAGGAGREAIPDHLRGQVFGVGGPSYWELESRFRRGAVVKRTQFSEEFGWDDFLATHEREDAPVIALVRVTRTGRVFVLAANAEVTPQPGDSVLAIVDPTADEAEEARRKRLRREQREEQERAEARQVPG